MPRLTFIILALHGVIPFAHAQTTALTDADVERMVQQRVARLKAMQKIEPGVKSGRFEGEMEGVHAGGVSALATLALLSAGLGEEDNTILMAVAYLEEVIMTGTYARALRANVWAHLLDRAPPTKRTRYYKLLKKDADWLVEAMDGAGWYTYGRERQRGDHSCTQYGVLGVWAAASAGILPTADYWTRVSKHWLEAQNTDGSWGYVQGDPGSSTMTVAGMSSLYITLAELHARREPAYQLFEGVRLDSKRQESVLATMAAAESGTRWLMDHELIPAERRDYQLFGLQRLALAGGYKFIGGRDWFRNGLKLLEDAQESNSVDTAFQLIFLTTGRAPVLFNKLQHGDDFTWNRYYRDLFFLTRRLSHLHENLYRWQILTLDAPMHDYHDAPFLVIEGDQPLVLADLYSEKLRDYIDTGGTIIGHANGASGVFAQSFKELFTRLFANRGMEFQPLPADHPVYSTVYKGGAQGWNPPIHIEGLSDGARTCVFLFLQDVAGAWHQNRHEQFPDLFRIMSNVCVYAAPRYDDLPKPLRPLRPSGEAAKPRGSLQVGRISHPQLGTVHPFYWERWAARFKHEYGIELRIDSVELNVKSRTLPGIRFLHLTGHQPFEMTDEEVKALAERIAGGAFLWIDAAGSRPAFIESADRLWSRLSTLLNGSVDRIQPTHPLLQGAFMNGRTLDKFRPNPWADARLRAESWPFLLRMSVGNRDVALYAPYDVTAATDGHFVYGAGGYHREDAQRLFINMILWRLDSTSL